MPTIQNPTVLTAKMNISSNVSFEMSTIDPNSELVFEGTRTNQVIDAVGQVPPSQSNPGTPWGTITNNGDPITVSVKLASALPSGVKIFLGSDYATTGYAYLTTTATPIWSNMGIGETRNIWAKAKFETNAPLGPLVVNIELSVN